MVFFASTETGSALPTFIAPRYLAAALRSTLKQSQLHQALLVGLEPQVSDHLGSFTEFCGISFKCRKVVQDVYKQGNASRSESPPSKEC